MMGKLLTSLAALAVVISCTAERTGPRPTTMHERDDPAPIEVDVHLNGRLVFSAEGDIWTMHADGSRRRKLTSHPAEDFDPVWSPDGMRIAFRTHRDGDEEVYVMRADGSGERNLTRSPTSEYSPAWSPDGTMIAFASDRDGDPNEIYVMDADGSNPTRITDQPGIDEYPAWSPDGSRLVFHCSMGGVNRNGTADFEICIVNLDGSGLVRLTDTMGENTQPNWSPDGEWTVFESNRLGWPTLHDATPEGYEPDASATRTCGSCGPTVRRSGTSPATRCRTTASRSGRRTDRGSCSLGTARCMWSIRTGGARPRFRTAPVPTGSRTGSPTPGS